ncbi:hypothetical protein [Geodermatophilus sp. SYSU D00696]
MAGLAVGSILLAGCGSQVSGGPSTASPSASPSPSPSESDVGELPSPEECADPGVYADWTEYCANVAEPSDATSEEPPSAAVNPRFGQTYTYENGLAVTVAPPQPYTPSDSAAVGEPAPPSFVVFDVTVANGTQANYDPATFMATMQSGTTEGQQVYDSANGIGGTPSTTLLPGRESTFRLAFGATHPNDLVLEVTPGFDYESAIFTS